MGLTQHKNFADAVDPQDATPLHQVQSIAAAAAPPLTSSAPSDVTKAPAVVGTGTTAARFDHKHDVSTGTPTVGAVAAGNSAAEGTATSLARSDHQHAVAVAAAVDVGTANAAGSASTLSRSDHVHNTPFSAVNTALGAANASINVNNQQITGAADPTTPQGVATKNYVDTLAAGLKWKKSVRVIATTAGNLATDFAAGQVVDGVTLILGDRIALAAQAAGAENGIYTVNASGAPTRATDADTGAELVAATFVSEAGTLNHDKAWVVTNDTITLGTTAITIVNFQVIVGALLAINNLSDLTNVVTARANLGLAAIAASGSASDLITGTIPQAATAAETGDVNKPAGSSVTTLANLPQSVLLARTAALTASMDVHAQQIINAADPTTPQALATKHYVDSSFSGGVPLVDGDKGDITVTAAGATWTIDPATVTNAKRANMAAGTISSNLTGGSAAPADNTLAAVKAALAIAFADIVGTLLAAQFPALTGDVTSIAGSLATTLANLPQTVLLARTAALTAAMDVHGQQITGLADPTTAQGAATKAYVDAALAGLKWKQSVVCASTTNITLSTGAQNGSVIDDITLTTGTRFALIHQTTASENGIYTANASGAPTRATDADTGTELVSCAFFVQQGTINADKAFVCTNDAITLGTTAINFVGFASVVGALIAANNLSDLTNVATARTNLGLVPVASGGALSTGQLPQFTGGSVTSPSAGSAHLDLVSIPDLTPVAGALVGAARTAPSIPAPGHGVFWFDTTDSIWKNIDESGNITHMTRAQTAIAHNFVTALNADGSVSVAQPSIADLQNIADQTILLNDSGSPRSPLAGTKARARTLLGLDAAQFFDLMLSYGVGDGTTSDSTTPASAGPGNAPFFLLPRTIQSDIALNTYSGGNADVNLSNAAGINDWEVTGPFGHAILYVNLRSISGLLGGGSVTFILSKNGLIDASPVSVTITTVGADSGVVALGGFSFAAGDRVGVRAQVLGQTHTAIQLLCRVTVHLTP